MSIRLYVGNLPAELDRQGLEKIFSESGESVSLKIITDRKTGKCRGFGFVTVGTPEVATVVIEKFNGFDFNGAVLKLEEALPRTKGQADGSPEGDHEGEEAPAKPIIASNVPAPTPRTSRQTPSQGGGGKSRRNNNNRGSSSSTVTTSSSSGSDEAHQPDPRWADKLEAFKRQLLAAQSV